MILSLGNASTQAPNPAGYTYKFSRGTSMAVPHVAGVVSLMLSRNPYLDFWSTRAILQNTATPFPFKNAPTFQCTSNPGDFQVQYCGAGMLNAGPAVTAALTATASAPNPPAGVSASPASASAAVSWNAPRPTAHHHRRRTSSPPTRAGRHARRVGCRARWGAWRTASRTRSRWSPPTDTAPVRRRRRRVRSHRSRRSSRSPPAACSTPAPAQGGVAAAKVQQPRLRIKVTGRNGVPAARRRGGVAERDGHAARRRRLRDGVAVRQRPTRRLESELRRRVRPCPTRSSHRSTPTARSASTATRSTHLIADVNGWFPVGSGFGAVSRAACFDTRSVRPRCRRRCGSGSPA